MPLGSPHVLLQVPHSDQRLQAEMADLLVVKYSIRNFVRLTWDQWKDLSDELGPLCIDGAGLHRTGLVARGESNQLLDIHLLFPGGEAVGYIFIGSTFYLSSSFCSSC